MTIQAIVKKNKKSRTGKGFSRGELKETGLSFNQALNMGIPTDVRGSTKHEENVKTLKTHLSLTYPESEEQKAEVTSHEVTLDLTKVKGIGPKLSEKLIKAGFKDVNQLSASSSEKVAKAIGVSEERAAIFIKNARSLLKE